MERLRPLVESSIAVFYIPPAQELIEFQERVLKGEIPEFLSAGRFPRIFDHYGEILRIRIPWGEDGLEKSYLAKMDKERNVTVRFEGFFLSDKHDWPKPSYE